MTAADGRAWAQSALANLPAGFVYVPAHEPSMWLRGRLVDLYNQVRVGQIQACEHLRLGSPTQPVLHVMWQPDHIWCLACWGHAAPIADENHRCDRCHQQAPRIHLKLTAPFGSLLVACGLCQDCSRREVPPT